MIFLKLIHFAVRLEQIENPKRLLEGRNRQAEVDKTLAAITEC